MTTELLIALGIFTLLNAGIVWFFFGRKKEEVKDDSGLLFIQNQINELTRTVDTKLGESNKEVQNAIRVQFSESAKIIKEVTEGLTKLDDTNRQVVSFADQLQSLQNILNNPKQRGVLGEYFLERVLQDVLPPDSFNTQYKIGSGDDNKDLIVDAVVFVKDQVVPIDAKFSLENYNRILEEENPVEKVKLEKLFLNDLKERIKETSKYIRPELGTTEFAFMFLPSEGIYYDLLSNKVGSLQDENNSLIQRAASQYKVIIVSPTTFLAYLQTVLQGLNAMKIEETAKDIIKRVGELGRHIKTYEEFMLKLGNTLGTTVNHYNKASKELGKVDKDIMRITGESPGLEPLTIEGPLQED